MSHDGRLKSGVLGLLLTILQIAILMVVSAIFYYLHDYVVTYLPPANHILNALELAEDALIVCEFAFVIFSLVCAFLTAILAPRGLALIMQPLRDFCAEVVFSGTFMVFMFGMAALLTISQDPRIPAAVSFKKLVFNWGISALFYIALCGFSWLLISSLYNAGKIKALPIVGWYKSKRRQT